MSAYMQMGYNTENLVGVAGLEDYKGIILSPTNRNPSELQQNVSNFRGKGTFELVLDPQLYFPKTERERLREHPYFPDDLDTADTYSPEWWLGISEKVVDFATSIGCDALCTPVVCPKVYNTGFYSVCIEVANSIYSFSKIKDMRLYQSVMIDLPSITDTDLLFKFSSIVSNTPADGFYVVFSSDREPRREFSDSDELFSAMAFIKLLSGIGKSIIIANCSSDMILFKSAGATHCATGKYFNLRRFTPSRFEEPTKEGGGGQLPYWFEHNLLAFIRESDLLRLQRDGYKDLIGGLHSNNEWAKAITRQFEDEPGKAWVGLSWRHFLSWFAKTELILNDEHSIEHVRAWTKSAEEAWLKLENDDIFMEEARNDGSWLRPWRQAISRFRKEYI